MEFEKYNPEEHEDLVPEFFSEMALEPQDFEEFQEAVKEALEDIDDVFGIEADFDVILANTDKEKVGKNLPPGYYFRGFSLGVGNHDYADRNIIFLQGLGPDEFEYWEAGMKNIAVHEEAHQEFYCYMRDLDDVIWESMIFEGHAMVRERIIRREKGYQWKGDLRKYEGSAEEIIDVIDKNRSWQGDKIDQNNTCEIFNGESEWEGIGYVIARELYDDILERNEMDVDEPLSKSREWLKSQVESSVHRVYG